MAAPQTSRRPYLIRAMHEWMSANNQTPHLVVDAAINGAEIPKAYVRDGRIAERSELARLQRAGDTD